MSLQALHTELSAAVQRAQQVASELTLVLGGLREAMKERGEWRPSSETSLAAPVPSPSKRDRASHEWMQCAAALEALNATSKTSHYATISTIADEVPQHPPINQKLKLISARVVHHLETGAKAGYFKQDAEGLAYQSTEKAEKKLAQWRRDEIFPPRR